MRLLFVVQRYGEEVAGGAETHCRQLAGRLAGRGHEVSVLTSTAASTADWASFYPPGDSDAHGVRVHRLAVAGEKDDAAFGAFTMRAIWGRPPPQLWVQERWLRAQGPALPGLLPWLDAHAAGYDAAAFVTYLFSTTWAGLPAVAGRLPTVLHATAHDEPYFWLPAFDGLLRLPSAYAWLTEEERLLLARRGAGRRPGVVVGTGIDEEAEEGGKGQPGPGTAVREAFPRLGERPYLVCVGRVSAGKGSLELLDLFASYKQRRPGPLALLLVGEPEVALPESDEVIATGFVDDALRRDAVAGSVALVQPSLFESFSLVLCEAWSLGRPAIVRGGTEVLAGMARRSGGGIAYHSYPEWEAAVDLLAGDPALGGVLGGVLGEAGRRHVEANYRWQAVLDRYESLLALAAHSFAGG